VDAAQSGVGGGSASGALPEHRIVPDKPLQWSFWLRPIAAEEAPREHSGLAFAAMRRALEPSQ